MIIPVGARRSPLSQAQVQEVLAALRLFHPAVSFEILLTDSTGDKDHETSLRTLDKTDFFTKEIDALVLNKQCRLGIHSAKDLPDPLPAGLGIVCVTAGVDPSDALVMRPGMTLETLPKGAIVATSSVRREAVVRQLRPDLQFVDIRGTIGQRLAKLDAGAVDGVVIAEAALIRLGLMHLNRLCLPGETAPYQGKLAVLARQDDAEMITLFECIDSRSKALYLGLKPPKDSLEKRFIHYPVIRIIPRPKESPEIRKALADWPAYTHVIFTSQSAIPYAGSLEGKCVIAVGKATAAALPRVDVVAQNEHAEGVVAELERMDLSAAYVFWPHSSLSRSILPDYLKRCGIRYQACVVYDTLLLHPEPVPDLKAVDEIIFTSPSTVDGFLNIFGAIPQDKVVTCIGPVTAKRFA